MVYVEYISPHILCYLGLIFLTDTLHFFIQRQCQAGGGEGWPAWNSVISLNPVETDGNTEAQGGPQGQARTARPALTTVFTALPAMVPQAITHSP